MAHTRNYRKKIPEQPYSAESMRMLIKFDYWRWIDLGLLIFSIGFLFAGRYMYIPVLFFLLTALEIFFEIAIKQSNREWQDTAEGKDWVRRMISAGRLFFIPVKLMIFFGALYLITVN